jgi:hypothetical protein
MKTIDLTGTWDALMTVTGGTQAPIGFEWTAVITVVQTGSTVSGKFETDMGLSGDISGSVLGDMVSMTINQGPIFPGTFHGSAKVTRKKMIGTYSGSDTNGTLEASFTASKAGIIGLGSLSWECACGIENSYSRSTCSNCKWTREQSERWRAENPGQGVNILRIDERDEFPPAITYVFRLFTVIALVGFAYSTCTKTFCDRKAAEQEEVKSKIHHGSVNEEGEGVQMDYAKADKGYQRAAEQGDDLSQLAVGK